MARRLVLDQLGLQLRGAALPNVQPVHDDAHMSAWHTSSAVVPAALAVAEREGRPGTDLITAVVAGVQVMGVLGSVTGSGMLARGWHGSKVLGSSGAAAAAGRLLGLDAAQLANAFGIAAQFSLAFGLGLQLVTGENRPQDYFDPARWSDPAITRIAEAVFPVAMEIPEGDPNLSASLDIELSDGRHRTAYQAGFHGHPVWPATDHDIQDKFRANLDGIATQETAQAITDIVSALDRAPSVRDLTRLLQQVA